MPRRGHYSQVPPEPVDPPSAVTARIGIRDAVSRPGTTRPAMHSTIDPSRFHCARLVGELADEWATWARLRLPDFTTLSVARSGILHFVTYADAHAPDPARLSLAAENPEVAGLMREWRRTLPAAFQQGSQRPWLLDNSLTRMVQLRVRRDDAVTGEPLRQLLSGDTSVPIGRTKELDEFTRAEKAALVRAAWAAVVEVERRLERGRALLKEARDPAVRGWLEPANLLGALAQGMEPQAFTRMMPDPRTWPRELTQFAASMHDGRNMRLGLMRSLTAMLYPRIEDLHPFRVLLVASTGLVDEIAALAEGDVEFTDADVTLTLTKMRAHTVRRRRFSGHGTLNAVEVVQRLMAVTEAARERYGAAPAPLFTSARVTVGFHLEFLAGRFGSGGKSFAVWARSRGVELSAPADIRRIRKAVKVEKIITHRGKIAAAADDHTVETFVGHYASGTTIRVIAGQIVVAAQQEWLTRAMSAPRILDQDTVDRLDDPAVRAELGLSEQSAEQVREGALNMGVTECRDPFDAPHGKAGELCAVAPLHCLECVNALILPSSLPQLLLMQDHIEAMRLRLAPPLFDELWGRRRANLHAALAERTPAEIEHGRHQIEQQDLRLQLPLASHVEFDL